MKIQGYYRFNSMKMAQEYAEKADKQIAELKAKVDRLTARGIEDLLHENAELKDWNRSAKESCAIASAEIAEKDRRIEELKTKLRQNTNEFLDASFNSMTKYETRIHELKAKNIQCNLDLIRQGKIIEKLEVAKSMNEEVIAELENAIVNIFKWAGGRRVARECRRVLPDVSERLDQQKKQDAILMEDENNEGNA